MVVVVPMMSKMTRIMMLIIIFTIEVKIAFKNEPLFPHLRLSWFVCTYLYRKAARKEIFGHALFKATKKTVAIHSYISCFVISRHCNSRVSRFRKTTCCPYSNEISVFYFYFLVPVGSPSRGGDVTCLLYTSDAADDC